MPEERNLDKEVDEKLIKYFRGLIHYQYDVNNDVTGADERMKMLVAHENAMFKAFIAENYIPKASLVKELHNVEQQYANIYRLINHI